jgi:predicted nucleotidyltransferase
MREAALGEGLSAQVATMLDDFVAAGRRALGSDLISVVLFGSAAEGRLSPTSDVNVLLVMRKFGPVGELRGAYLAAEAAVKLRAMYVLESELPAATELFAQKFADILRRRRVLFGPDPFVAARIPRAAEIFRVRQVLLNLTLRLREACVARGDRPEQISRLLADAVGPVRAACAILLELEGAAAGDGEAALTAVAASCGEAELVARLRAAHDGQMLGDEAEPVLLRTIEFLGRIAQRAARLTEARA